MSTATVDAGASGAGARGPLGAAWAALSSERTTAALVLLMSGAAAVAAFVPQGAAAIEYAREPGAALLHELAAWGLTDVFGSAWVRAIGVLLVGNLLAVAMGGLGRRVAVRAEVAPPRSAPHDERLEARFPELAFEAMRGTFEDRLGLPVAEETKGARSTLVFEAGSGRAMAPMFAHVGLLVLVLGAGLHAARRDEKATVPHAVLKVIEPTTGTHGEFDMVAGEWFKFFQSRDEYAIVGFTRSKDGLGPAVRMERRAPGQPRGESFWVYLRAPAGFDQRHRRDRFAIEALQMDIRPTPGAGLADSPIGALMLFGLAALLFGVRQGQGARGRVWVEVEGRTVRLLGVPHLAGDREFAARFERWSLEARAALEQS